MFSLLPMDTRFKFVARPDALPTEHPDIQFMKTGAIKYSLVCPEQIFEYTVGNPAVDTQIVMLPLSCTNISLSHGTMISEHVFDSVRQLLPKKLITEFETAFNAGRFGIADLVLTEDIWAYLNEIAPTGCYFGSHPGDGSDYGFWQDEEV